jgi:hypothetical protein
MSRSITASLAVVVASLALALTGRAVADEKAAEGQVQEEGFVSLFDGETLKGWEGKDFWSVRDGAISGETTAEKPTQGNTFLIWRGGEVADFELRCQFRIRNHNSGIQYRSSELDNFVVGGYQADIDPTGRYMGILYEERGRGILAERGTVVEVDSSGKKNFVGTTGDASVILKAVKDGEWNEYVIIAKGNHLVQKINGLTTMELIDNQADRRKLKGILALQLHAGPPMLVQFKDLRIKHLD